MSISSLAAARTEVTHCSGALRDFPTKRRYATQTAKMAEMTLCNHQTTIFSYGQIKPYYSPSACQQVMYYVLSFIKYAGKNLNHLLANVLERACFLVVNTGTIVSLAAVKGFPLKDGAKV